jgi:hypothetical protein
MEKALTFKNAADEAAYYKAEIDKFRPVIQAAGLEGSE